MEKQELLLKFHGPFSFGEDRDSLFKCDFASQKGIYIWTIKDALHKINYIHYIGITDRTFAERQREHLIHILGQDYRIIDVNAARRGEENIVWNGLWRDKSEGAIQKLLTQYANTSKKVVDYVKLINVYFAPTSLHNNLLCHIEGSLGWNLREKYPNLTLFYPTDNYVRKEKEKRNIRLLIELSEPIAGIDNELII